MGRHGHDVSLGFDLHEQPGGERRHIVPLNYLGVADHALEFGDGECSELLALLFGESCPARVFLVFVGDIVVVVEKDIALVAGIGFLGNAVTIDGSTELGKDVSVGSQGFVVTQGVLEVRLLYGDCDLGRIRTRLAIGVVGLVRLDCMFVRSGRAFILRLVRLLGDVRMIAWGEK